ncbi:MAG: tRNA (adenosine(37)-N6)-dimethylallyltransferase MiaA [Candidatus Paceibacterota bacterium]|jgi:tRNA dimethylallyltransferase
MKKNKNNKKMIVIVGPTASGKTGLSIKLAKVFGGEIISADSRQVYKQMDIGTAKASKKEMAGIPHHLLDVASPKKKFTVAQYRKLGIKALNAIFKKNKLPIVCGGTGFYVQALIDGIVMPEVKPDWKLRKDLEQKTVEELYQMIKKLDPRRAGNIDKKNPRRLIRAIEISITTKKPIPTIKMNPLPYPVLLLGAQKDPEKLKKDIEKRFYLWLKQGLLNEIKNLYKSGLSWKRIEEFGMHYRAFALYLQGKITREEAEKRSLKELWQYTKRQTTWFKRDQRIIWVKNYAEAKKLAKNFLAEY